MVFSDVVLELLVKLVLAPLLVVAVTLAARRWGETVGGALIAIPTVAGPILLVLGLEQGMAFVHLAALAALLGLVAVAAFCVTVVQCLRYGWFTAIGTGWLCYGLVTVPLATVELPGWLAFLAGVVAITGARICTRSDGAAQLSRSQVPPWDLPARAIVTAVLVLVLTSAAAFLGPSVSGLLTPFPVATSVVVAFTHVQAGPDAARRVIHGYVRGLPGFALFFLIVAVTT